MHEQIDVLRLVDVEAAGRERVFRRRVGQMTTRATEVAQRRHVELEPVTDVEKDGQAVLGAEQLVHFAADRWVLHHLPAKRPL